MSFTEIDSDSRSDDEYEYEYNSEEEEEAEKGPQPRTIEPTVLIRRSVTSTTAEERDASIASSSASSSVMLSSVADESMCVSCGRETHAPVDCETLRRWHTMDSSRVVLTMPSTLLTPVLHRLVEEVATQWKISPVAAAALLHDVNWDAERLTTPSMRIRQTNVLRVELASGVSERGRVHRATTPIEGQTTNHVHELARPLLSFFSRMFVGTNLYAPKCLNGIGSCEICMETEVPMDQMVSMPCGHAYCKGCWAGFFTDTVETTGHCLRLRCPDARCNERVTEEEIIKSAPELLPRYREQQLSSFLTGIGNSRYARSCPGIGCKYIAVPSQHQRFGYIGSSVPVSCGGCSTEFCFRCGEASHDFYCQIRNERPEDEGDYKKCPQCQVQIEKNGGCNHMTCRCGHEFCWLCLGDAQGAHGIHVCGVELETERGVQGRDNVAERLDDEERRCPTIPHLPSFDLGYVCSTLEGYNGTEQQEDARLLLEKVKEMTRYEHCYARYEAHDQGQQHAASRTTDLALQQDAIFQLPDIADADFLSTANARLVILRRFLKYSYILSYYFAVNMDENGMQKDRFLHRQAMLERFTEQLSRASENATSQSEKSQVLNLMVILEKFFDESFGSYARNCIMRAR